MAHFKRLLITGKRSRVIAQVTIETLSKRGYRFIGTVQNGASAVSQEVSDAVATETTVPDTHRKNFTWGLASGAGVAVALVLVLGLNTAGMRDRLLGKTTAPRIQSLAVLPLRNLSSDPNQEYFSEGLTDGLITDLAQIGSVKVVSRTSSMQLQFLWPSSAQNSTLGPSIFPKDYFAII